MSEISSNLTVDGTPEEALQPVSTEIVNVLVANHARFRSFIAKRVGSESVAEDLLQHSVKKALEHPADSKDEISITAWFYRILRNSLTDYYRSRSREDKKHAELAHALGSENLITPSLDDMEAGVCECMTALLPTLKEGYADIIRRVDLENESIPEVAKALGVTVNNLTVRLHRARQALKLSLQRTCGACIEHGCLNCTCS